MLWNCRHSCRSMISNLCFYLTNKNVNSSQSWFKETILFSASIDSRKYKTRERNVQAWLCKSEQNRRGSLQHHSIFQSLSLSAERSIQYGELWNHLMNRNAEPHPESSRDHLLQDFTSFKRCLKIYVCVDMRGNKSISFPSILMALPHIIVSLYSLLFYHFHL